MGWMEWRPRSVHPPGRHHSRRSQPARHGQRLQRGPVRDAVALPDSDGPRRLVQRGDVRGELEKEGIQIDRRQRPGPDALRGHDPLCWANPLEWRGRARHGVRQLQGRHRQVDLRLQRGGSELQHVPNSGDPARRGQEGGVRGDAPGWNLLCLPRHRGDALPGTVRRTNPSGKLERRLHHRVPDGGPGRRCPVPGVQPPGQRAWLHVRLRPADKEEEVDLRLHPVVGWKAACHAGPGHRAERSDGGQERPHRLHRLGQQCVRG
mmetsp:Transcript_2034/g.4517  ORF Transcript_2034/g.4517 Transcript_2034/m.4517 type:complete len:263 (+) Transcript_2034:333-1121(+)